MKSLLRNSIHIVVLALLLVLSSASPIQAQESRVQDPMAPPPLKTISRLERSQLNESKDAKARVKTTLELATVHLAEAEAQTLQHDYSAAGAEAGRYWALVDDVFAFLKTMNRDSGKTRDLYKRVELALRAHGPRLTMIRRSTPSEYSVWIKEIEDFARAGRSEALDSFYGHTVSRDQPSNQEPANKPPVRIENLPPPPQMPLPKPSPSPRPPTDDEIDVVRVTSNLVVVPVSVTDTKGQPTLGLSAADFRLEEQGQPQGIAQIGNPEQVPLEIALLLDVSGSVEARFDFERESASRFLKQVLKSGDRAAIFAIDQEPRFEQGLDSAARASNKLMSIGSAKGPTAFYDTVIEAAHYLAKSSPSEHRRVIVVISDGEDNFSEKIKKAIGDTRQAQDTATPQARRLVNNRMVVEVQRELQQADATFYSINPSGPGLHLNIISQRAQDGMEQLATSTGGTSFVPERLDNLDAVFRQITAELRSQYLLQYYSKSEAPSGTYLAIGVQVPNRSDVKVRARQGYYVKRK